MVQQVKDPVLSLWWLGSLLGGGLIPGLGTSTCGGGGKKKLYLKNFHDRCNTVFLAI